MTGFLFDLCVSMYIFPLHVYTAHITAIAKTLQSMNLGDRRNTIAFLLIIIYSLSQCFSFSFQQPGVLSYFIATKTYTIWLLCIFCSKLLQWSWTIGSMLLSIYSILTSITAAVTERRENIGDAVGTSLIQIDGGKMYHIKADNALNIIISLVSLFVTIILLVIVLLIRSNL